MDDIQKLFEALDNLDAAYIKIGCGNHCIIVGSKEFSDWVDQSWDDDG